MKWTTWSLALAVLLTGCAADIEKSTKADLYKTYDTHCREYARQMLAEVDHEARYQECISYFIRHDDDCKYCVLNATKK